MHEDSAVPLDRLLTHRSWIRALARSLVRDSSAVDDIEQDVYVAAMKGPKIETSLRGWLRAVVKNAAYQRHRGDTRRAAREVRATPPSLPRSPAAIVAEADSHRHVVQAVMELDEPYRSTVLVRYFEGLTLAETAARLSVPRETVKTRMRRAHGMLRERLRREHGDEGRGVPAVLVPLVGGPAGLTELLRHVPDAVVGARPFTPLAAAAGLIGAAVLVGSAVYASTGDGVGADGVVFAVAPPQDGDGGAGGEGGSGDEDASGDPPPRRGEARRRVGDRPAEKGNPPVPADTAPPVADHFVVRDLLSREPVPHLALEVTHDGTQAAVAADDHGRVALPPAAVTAVRAESDVWTVPGGPRVFALHEGDLWVHRTVEIDVEVRDADPRRTLRVGTARVSHFTAESTLDRKGGGPGTYAFNRQTGLSQPHRGEPVAADGSVRLRVPAVRGLHVSATAPGCRPVSARVSFESTGDGPIVLELRAGFSIDGRVVNDEGHPVPGADVRIEVSRSGSGAPPNIELLRAEGGGGMGFTSGAKGWGVSWAHSARPNPRGIFQTDVTVDGDVRLIVTADGYIQQRVDLGRLSADRKMLGITLQRPNPDVLTQLLLNGKPVAKTRVLFHDVTGTPQISTYVTTDAAGRFPSDLLLEGRRYTVGVPVPGDKPHELRLVTWDRRKTVHVEKLSQDFEGDDE